MLLSATCNKHVKTLIDWIILHKFVYPFLLKSSTKFVSVLHLATASIVYLGTVTNFCQIMCSKLSTYCDTWWLKWVPKILDLNFLDMFFMECSYSSRHFTPISKINLLSSIHCCPPPKSVIQECTKWPSPCRIFNFFHFLKKKKHHEDYDTAWVLR